MNDELNEYKQKPILSKVAQEFVSTYKASSPVPPEIRAELEKYVIDMTPFANSAYEKIKLRFEKIFNK